MCHHASGEIREYVESAIKAGVKILGFSDHAPMPFDDGYISGVRMTPSEAETYVNTLSKLKDEYKKEIEIHIGFEAEYDPTLFDKMIKLHEELGAEYLILGQHFIGREQDRVFGSRESDDVEKMRKYTDQVIAGIETGKYTYVAHPDMLNYPKDDEHFREQATRLCVRAKELSIPLEYNLLGILGKRHYPTDKFFRIASEIGNDVIIGRDAHYPDAFLDNDSEQKALEALSRLGITPITKLTFRPV